MIKNFKKNRQYRSFDQYCSAFFPRSAPKLELPVSPDQAGAQLAKKALQAIKLILSSKTQR